MTEDELDSLFNATPQDWVACLAPFQREPIAELLVKNSPEDVAGKWLQANLNNTSRFGADNKTNSSIYLNKLVEEVEAFLCGGAQYKKERAELLKQTNNGRAYLVGVLSVAIAPALGASAVFLAPAIVLILASLGKISIQAWCKTRAQARQENLAKPES